MSLGASLTQSLFFQSLVAHPGHSGSCHRGPGLRAVQHCYRNILFFSWLPLLTRGPAGAGQGCALISQLNGKRAVFSPSGPGGSLSLFQAEAWQPCMRGPDGRKVLAIMHSFHGKHVRGAHISGLAVGIPLIYGVWQATLSNCSGG